MASYLLLGLRMRNAMFVLAILVAAGCEGHSGSGAASTPDPDPGINPIALVVTCAGAPCGMTGALTAQIQPCSGATVDLQISWPAVTLSSNDAPLAIIDAIPYGSWCAVTFLDLDGSGVIKPGDPVRSSGPLPFTDTAGVNLNLPIVLDALAP